ncbi:fatty-acid-binding protein 1 [Iris pallida]|uniref:Chalcone--flavanone isomerase n=1 Tax=Iris pallida TaxID=29817 RepID=A0AAX6EIB6_IRIPA|nr:fatty-acid-binding protein 1 [Iris pallida]
MVSLRFPFPFPNNSGPNPPNLPRPSTRSLAAAAGAAVGIGVGIAVSLKSASANQTDPSRPNTSSAPISPLWACLSFSDAASDSASVEPKTGATFPNALDGGSRRLLGLGVRRKSVFGLKNVDVYAFGVYADESDVKRLSENYEAHSSPELKENKDFIADVLEQDLRMTIRLQIVYGRLSIRSVRSAFEESVGNRLQKFGGSDNKELLQRFTSLFKDEYKLPRGSIIDLSKEPGFVLQTRIDGKDVGSIQSKLLCQSIFDLYVGEDPFDRKAKEDFKLGLASLVKQ